MPRLNLGRWLLGGLTAGIVIQVVHQATATLYRTDLEATLAAHGLSLEPGLAAFLLGLAAHLVTGWVVVFLYASARPQFGPGPRTAVIVAVALWFGSTLVARLDEATLGLFPARLLVTWGAFGLIELVLGAAVGGWLYREG